MQDPLPAELELLSAPSRGFGVLVARLAPNMPMKHSGPVLAVVAASIYVHLMGGLYWGARFLIDR